jgi:glycosyltransferase involved in cell wall biosynthesis
MEARSDLKVSAVVCTYNGEKFLAEQLHSIAHQSRQPDEIIVSDDGSTDSTLDIVTEFSSGASAAGPTWKLLTRGKPLGVAGNFAHALSQARGDIIALADQDDIWEPHRVESGLAYFRDASVLLVHSDAILIDAKGNAIGSLMAFLRLSRGERHNLRSGKALDALLRRNLVTGATTMIRSSLLERALPVPEGWIHDEWLALVAAMEGEVVFSDSPVIRYRQHQGNEIGVEKITVGAASLRLREPRTEFFRRKLLRNSGLQQLLSSSVPPGTEPAREKLRAKIDFDTWRSELPIRRLRRLFPVAGRYARGDYGRFARGFIDVLRDLSLRD